MKNTAAVDSLVRLLCVIFLFFVLAYFMLIMGLASPAIPEGKVGVLYTSSRGYRLIPHTFFWTWERFVPGSFKVYALDNDYRSLPFNAAGLLPEAAMVQTFPQFARANLRYELDGNIEYRLSLEGMIWALSNNYLRPTELAQYYANLDQKITAAIDSFLIYNPEMWNNEQEPSTELLNALKQAFPHIEFSDLTVARSLRPDLLVYQQGIDLIQLEHRLFKEARELESQQNIQITVEQERRLKLLEQYGTLLTKYPILITFFAVDSQKILPRDVLENFVPSKVLMPPAPGTSAAVAPPDLSIQP